MQIFTMRYNLEFRKLTLYGITRSQSIRKSHNLEFNPNFAKTSDIPAVKNSVIYTRPYLTLIKCQIPAPGGGGGGVLDQYLGIGEPLRV